jgi:GDP-L-fucose synthase
MGELTLDSLRIQYGWDNWTVIRPSNIYGTNDNFAQDATVISSNIWKLFNVEGDDMVCWGNGSSKRDFVFGDDVAQATIDVVKKEVKDIINFGCGEAVTIKETIETIVEAYKEISGIEKNIVWDETKTNGDAIRCLGSKKQTKYGMINAPPPFSIACAGKRRKLPRPTALPAIANMRPILEPQPVDV